MENFAKLLDKLLLDFAAYPTTLWNLVVSPDNVFHSEPTALITSPAVTYILSCAFTYIAFNIVSARLTIIPQKLSETMREPGKFATAAVVYIAFIANIQRFVIALLADISSVPLSEQLQLLVYTFCPGVVIGAIYLMFAGLWPRKLVVAFLGLGAAALYMWSLWQGCRLVLDLSPGRAALATLASTLAAIVVVNIAGLGFVWILNRVDDKQSPA